MGERGGKREGAGRKKKDIQLGLDLQKNVSDMVKQKAALLAALHTRERIERFITVLDEMLNSERETVRRDGAKMFYEILIKTQAPAELTPGSSGEQTAEQLANLFRKELAEKNKQEGLNGDSDMDSIGTDGLSSSKDSGGDDANKA